MSTERTSLCDRTGVQPPASGTKSDPEGRLNSRKFPCPFVPRARLVSPRAPSGSPGGLCGSTSRHAGPRCEDHRHHSPSVLLLAASRATRRGTVGNSGPAQIALSAPLDPERERLGPEVLARDHRGLGCAFSTSPCLTRTIPPRAREPRTKCPATAYATGLRGAEHKQYRGAGPWHTCTSSCPPSARSSAATATPCAGISTVPTSRSRCRRTSSPPAPKRWTSWTNTSGSATR